MKHLASLYIMEDFGDLDVQRPDRCFDDSHSPNTRPTTKTAAAAVNSCCHHDRGRRVYVTNKIPLCQPWVRQLIAENY